MTLNINSIYTTDPMVEEYRDMFSRHRIAVLPNFLTDECAESLYACLNSPPSDSFFKHSIMIRDKVQLVNFDQTELINDLRATAERYYKDHRKLSYSFARTVKHNCECTCGLCDFRSTQLGSPDMLSFFSSITGKDLIKPKEIFADYFRDGDFLDSHEDNGLGTIGFSIMLSKDWNATYGGTFYLKDGKDDISIVPNFNTLILFDIGVSHGVTHVNSGGKDIKRLTVSGWFR